MHDPGVVVRVFEKDEDAMRDPLKTQEYFIKDGVINTNAWVYKYPSMTEMLKTNTIKLFFKDKFNSNLNISNLVFEQGGNAAASTTIAFIFDVIYKRDNNKNDTITRVESIEILEKLYKEQYNNAKITLRIYNSRQLVLNNDLYFAHELLIHGILMIDEINKLDLKTLSIAEAKTKISEIYLKTKYISDDDGARDHALFLTGEKKEMTAYLLERLKSMKTESERWEYLRRLIVSKDFYGSIYWYVNDSKIIKYFPGGKPALIKKLKFYLENDFKDYHDLIFKPFSGETTSLWDTLEK
jgi:hypothetical protein